MLDIVTRHDLPTVLLIDDDMVSREVMATLLTMSGYPVHTAADGPAALDLLAGGECDPGVILMAAQMPGLSGTQLIEQLRARTHARLYAISASNPPPHVVAATDGFLLKPFPPEALTRLIEEHLAQSQPPAAHGLDPDDIIVNPETLAQLREMMPDAAVRQIYEAIVADLARRITALEAAIAKNDDAEVRRLGHTIKGGCSMAGALQAARIGGMIEAGGIEVMGPAVNHLDNGSAVLRDLRAAAAALQRMLEGEFQG